MISKFLHNVNMTGKLRCVGQYKSEHQLVSTCTSLKKGGTSADGFYMLKVILF